MLDDVDRLILDWDLDSHALGGIEKEDFCFQEVLTILLRRLDHEGTWVLVLQNCREHWFRFNLDGLLPNWHRHPVRARLLRLSVVDNGLKWLARHPKLLFGLDRWWVHFDLYFILHEHLFVELVYVLLDGIVVYYSVLIKICGVMCFKEHAQDLVNDLAAHFGYSLKLFLFIFHFLNWVRVAALLRFVFNDGHFCASRYRNDFVYFSA